MNTFLSEYIFGNNSNSKNDKDISKTLDVDCKIPKHCHSNPLSEYLTETVQIITASRLYNVHVCDLDSNMCSPLCAICPQGRKVIFSRQISRSVYCVAFILFFNLIKDPPRRPLRQLRASERRGKGL